MKKARERLLFISVVGLFVLYAAGSAVDLAVLADFGAPASELFCALVLFLTARGVTRFRWTWIFFGLSCLSYGIMDLVWVGYANLLMINPEGVGWIYYAYLLPNAAILGGTIAFYAKLGYRWNTNQLVLDAASMTMALAFGFWLLFFRDWSFEAMLEDPYLFALLFYILVDFITLALAGAMLLFHGLRRANAPIRWVLGGALLFIGTDLVYVYNVYHDRYIPNDPTDVLFVLSMSMFAIGAILRMRAPENEYGYEIKDVLDKEYARPGMKILWLLLLPVLLFAAGYTRVDLLLAVLAIIVLYFLGSGFLYNAARNESLLKRELAHNEDLEVQVQARVAELQAAYEELDELVKSDTLTKLANRRHFFTWLEHELDGRPEQDRLAVFYIDIDKFKAINDTYGHDVGDRILIEYSNRLSGWCGKDMFLARISSDEFALVIKESDWASLALLAQEIVSLTERDMDIRGYRFRLTASVGIALWPEDALDCATLVQNADIAMYQAKERKTGHVSFFSSWFSETIRRRQEIDVRLRNADYDGGEFELHYQPQFSTKDRSLIGMEALIRWTPEPGVRIPPSDFIPIAEENGLIAPLGEWVLSTAIRQIGIWNARSGLNLRMGINLSPKQFLSRNLFFHIAASLKQYHVKPEWIDIEITESSAMNTDPSSESSLMKLTEMGLSISIDDFGTGYSSLNYIKRFDIDALKIAKPLVDSIAEDDGDVRIVQAIVHMAAAMQLRTIAEGVESEEQFETLARIGCDEIQGYLLGRPVPAAEFEEKFIRAHLERHRRPAAEERHE